MDAGARADGGAPPIEVERTLALDDVDHLVVDVAVIRRSAGVDHAEKLGDVVRADLLIGEVAEAALASGGKRRPVGPADGALLRRVRPVLLREADGDDDELV